MAAFGRFSPLATLAAAPAAAPAPQLTELAKTPALPQRQGAFGRLGGWLASRDWERIGAAMRDDPSILQNLIEQRRQAASDARQAAEAEATRRTGKAQNETLQNWIRTLPAELQGPAQIAPAQVLSSQLPMSAEDRATIDFRDRQLAEDARHNRATEGADWARINQRELVPWNPQGVDRVTMTQQMQTAQQAAEGLNLVDQFLAANANTGTGPVGQYTQYFSPDMAGMRQTSALLQTMMAPQGQGSVSNYERSLFRQGAPEPGLTGPQNQQRAENLRTLLQVRQARALFYDQYGQEHHHLRGAEEAFQRSEEFRALTQRRSSTPSGANNRQRGAAVPRAADVGRPPAGVSAVEWQNMTPEERALWQN